MTRLLAFGAAVLVLAGCDDSLPPMAPDIPLPPLFAISTGFTQGVCGQTVTTGETVGGTLTLTQDLLCTNSDGITIDDGVTLDCAGHAIRLIGNDGTIRRGVQGVTDPSADNTTITNCTVDGFAGGIDIVGSNVTVVDNTLQNNGNGILLRGNNLTVQTNRVEGSTTFGIALEFRTNNALVEGNVITQTGGLAAFRAGDDATGIQLVDNEITTVAAGTLQGSVRFFRSTFDGSVIQGNTISQTGDPFYRVLSVAGSGRGLRNLQILDNTITLDDPAPDVNTQVIRVAEQVTTPSSNIVVGRNDITMLTEEFAAIAFLFSTNSQIIDNVVNGRAGESISLLGVSNSLVAGNQVAIAGQRDAIKLDGAGYLGGTGGNNVVEENTVESIQVFGDGPNTVILGNDVATSIELAANSDNGIIHDNDLGALILHDNLGTQVFHNDLENVTANGAIELSVNSEGNYWKTASDGTPYSCDDTQFFESGFDSNRSDVIDSHPYAVPIAGRTTGFGQIIPPGIPVAPPAPLGPPICAVEVEIDIKPGSDPNSINLGSNGTVPVAIFSTANFDATTVNPSTVTLADAAVKVRGKGTPMADADDVNGDGVLDLVVHVETSGLALTEGDTEAVLDGETFDGTPIWGSDSVRVVP